MIVCPICEQGEVAAYSVLSTKEIIFLCEECEALWISGKISSENALSFDNFMKERGLTTMWGELSEIE